jgi:uncharacterized coiled-coil protein SlyX
MDDEAMTRLETKLAFLEKAANELSDVVYRQQQDIAALNERLAALAGRFDILVSNDRAYTSDEERPPHY